MDHIRQWASLLRVHQWTKNFVVFAALVFGTPTVDHPVIRSLITFVAFCLMSSAGYIFNDVRDIESDRVHPIKRTRPLASGAILVSAASFLMPILAIASLVLAIGLNPSTAAVLVVYALLTLAYSIWLKNYVLVDVLVISIGFLLRAVAGATAIDVPVSPWLLLCTILLAMFLGFGKRRSELVNLGPLATESRSALASYTVPFLDQLLVITSACTIMAYSFYTFTADNVPQNSVMMITVPFVIFAIFRYLFLIMSKGAGETPELLLWKDAPLLFSVAGWSISVVAIMMFV